MQRIRTEILPGVWLTALRTEKFKTAWLSVNLLTQLRRETAACTAVLPYVLRRGTKSLPDMRRISERLDALYGAEIEPSVRKLGEIQAVGFYYEHIAKRPQEEAAVYGDYDIIELWEASA